MKFNLNNFFIYIIVASLVVGGIVFAGSLSPEVGVTTNTPNFITLEDLYQKVQLFTYSTSSHEVSTSSTPLNSMHTLQEIWDSLTANPITSDIIISGHTIFGVIGTGIEAAPIFWSENFGLKTWGNATSTCASAGGSLPRIGELIKALSNQFLDGGSGVPGGFEAGEGYWSGTAVDDDFAYWADNNVGVIPAAKSSTKKVRCVSSSSFTATVPDAPTGVLAISGDGEAVVTFTPPSYNGGSPILGYTVISNPGNKIGIGTSSPIIVTDLTNGTEYTFTVFASSTRGESNASATSSVILVGLPGAPTIGSVYPGDGFAIVNFTPPLNDGGSSITSYTASTPDGAHTATGTSTPIRVSGLTNGNIYRFKVKAMNTFGFGPFSSTSSFVTVGTVPGAPTEVVAVPGSGNANIFFNPPTFTGGASVTSYVATSDPGGITNNNSTSPILISGLSDGTPYTFTVIALNMFGASSSSVPSSAVTPASTPDAPTIQSVVSGPGGAVYVSYLSGYDGGSVITGYTIDPHGAGQKVHADPGLDPFPIYGLASGSYHFTMTATNAMGTSSDSSGVDFTYSN